LTVPHSNPHTTESRAAPSRTTEFGPCRDKASLWAPRVIPGVQDLRKRGRAAFKNLKEQTASSAFCTSNGVMLLSLCIVVEDQEVICKTDYLG
jgi:hypothetical protein